MSDVDRYRSCDQRCQVCRRFFDPRNEDGWSVRVAANVMEEVWNVTHIKRPGKSEITCSRCRLIDGGKDGERT